MIDLKEVFQGLDPNQMEQSKTPHHDFYPKAVSTIVQCQSILAEYIVPDSGISDRECINMLLGVLDDRELVKTINELTK